MVLDNHGPDMAVMGSLFVAMIMGLILHAIFEWYWLVICISVVVGFWIAVELFWAIANHIDNLKARKEGRQIKRPCPSCHRNVWFVRYGRPEGGTAYFWICPMCDVWVARESRSGGNWIHTDGYEEWLDGVKG